MNSEHPLENTKLQMSKLAETDLTITMQLQDIDSILSEANKTLRERLIVTANKLSERMAYFREGASVVESFFTTPSKSSCACSTDEFTTPSRSLTGEELTSGQEWLSLGKNLKVDFENIHKPGNVKTSSGLPPIVETPEVSRDFDLPRLMTIERRQG